MTLFQFLADLNIVAASLFTPQDAYVAQMCGAMEAINAGVTTVLDHYHLANSAAHVQSGLTATQHSGLRSIFAMGTNQVGEFPLAKKRATGITARADASNKELVFGDPGWQQPLFEELAADSRKPSGLVTLGLALDRWKKMPQEELQSFVSIARSHGVAPMTLHLSNGVLNGQTDEPLITSSLSTILGPDLVLSHANLLTDRELRTASHAGVRLSATPETEHHLNMGTSIVERADCHGCHAALGSDTTSVVEGGMFGILRASLAELRRSRNDSMAARGQFPRKGTPSVQSAFLRGTIGGAEVLGKNKGTERIGLLEENARADIVLLDGRSYNMLGALWNGRDAVAAVVGQASIADVKDVFVNGRRLKHDGKLAPLSSEARLALRSIARDLGVDVDPKEQDHDLLRKVAEKSAHNILERAKHIDLEAVRQQVGNFLGVNARLC